jgi:glycosyltransferase involved in cell wall biosynthesis
VPEAVRVLHVITRMNVGGPARHLLTLLPMLRERGFEPLLVHGTAEPEEGELSPGDIPTIRVPALRRPIDPPADVRAAVELRRIVKRSRPALVHTHLSKAGALGRIAARREQVPALVHTFHGHVLEGYFATPSNKLFVGTERRLAGRTDALIAVSRAVRDELLRLGIGDAARWRVIPLGFDLEHPGDEVTDRNEARRLLDVPPTGPTIGIVGRLVPIKNHVLFLEAGRRLLDRWPDATFVIAGDGELRTALEGEATRLLGDRVRFTGWVRSLPELYAALDVVVLASLNEGTPVTLIEAAAAGLPVVATNVGGVADVVVDGESGYLVPSGDASALATRIGEVLEDPGIGRRMGEAGRLRVRTAFSPQVMADRIAELYRELLEAKGRPAG